MGPFRTSPVSYPIPPQRQDTYSESHSEFVQFKHLAAGRSETEATFRIVQERSLGQADGFAGGEFDGQAELPGSDRLRDDQVAETAISGRRTARPVQRRLEREIVHRAVESQTSAVSSIKKFKVSS